MSDFTYEVPPGARTVKTSDKYGNDTGSFRIKLMLTDRFGDEYAKPHIELDGCICVDEESFERIVDATRKKFEEGRALYE